ncbi:Cupin RmlC-type [Venturia nashicola]|uniref:Cupin RmlC-type n=1 Tax=Venturia nashicola TaxID=86259 RepID=A0A4Z1PLN1_9PEZI|nr:Cupin RmlC-type [Venturia nashicola]TLD38711.1 Cupin RmlC-type [Venturia nashicola]
MTSWLQKQRKADLRELAQAANVEDWEDLLKDDLVSSISEHLSNNPSNASNPIFSGFYARGGSPVKRDRGISVPLKEEGGLSVARRRRTITRTSTKEEESSPLRGDIPEPSTALATRTPRAVQRLAERVPLPPSPQVIANMIGEQELVARNKIKAAWERSGTTELIEELQTKASTVVSVEALALAIECYGVIKEVFPLAYAFQAPAIEALGTNAFGVWLPDLFLLFTTFFWSPTGLWLGTSLFLPLLFAYFFNFTSQIKTPRTRAAAASVYKYDPLTFNVVKALTAWLVYSQGFRFGGVLSDATALRVNGALPGGFGGVLIGSGIGALASIYEAILQRY